MIHTEGLTRRLGRVLAVDDLALRVPQGSVYGFLGPNGAGKTTTIRLLLGLIRPDAGEVRLFGEPLRGRRGALLRRVGALVEGASFYPQLTGRENLEVTRRLIGASVAQRERALALVRLADVADRPAKTYSQGMKQRLGLALALLPEPELLLLDEPTSSLDPAGIREIRELVATLPRESGATVFLSSHLLAEVEQVATHIGIIQQGRLRFQGTQAALQARLAGTVTVCVDRPEEARRLLEQRGWGVRVGAPDQGGQRLVASVQGPEQAAALNAALVRAGLAVSQLRYERPTLEELFLALTEPGQPSPPAAHAPLRGGTTPCRPS